MALRLLTKQLHEVHNDLPPERGFSAGPLEDDMLKWEASVMGPSDSPYSGGQFWLRLDFPVDYPFRPPKVWFLTKIYHPNVDNKGRICADFLQSEWKPKYSVMYVINAILSLMLHPCPENPVEQEIADMYIKDYDKFYATAVQCTDEHAPPDKN